METLVDICHVVVDEKTEAKCGLPLEECRIQSHWEARLKVYRLTEKRACEPRFKDFTGEEVNREYPMNIQELDETVVGPLVIPNDEKVAEVFVMDSLGLRYPSLEAKRFWPFPGSVNRSAYIKSGRMGLAYGQELPK